MNLFWLALSFLTTIPAKQIPYIPGGLGKSSTLFPLIGFIIGSLVLGSMWLIESFLADPIVAMIGLSVWVLLTGGLHLDGLADCCDGLLGAASKEKRLDILKDPRTGSFAVIGLILALGLKSITIYVILESGTSSWGWLPFLLAPALARFLILPAAIQPQARPGGMGSDFAASVTNNIMGLAAILPLILLLLGFL
ncbi:MAG: adenosylcobinamide-GDP ribazoletransferase, partial [Chloroflexota bacterium]